MHSAPTSSHSLGKGVLTSRLGGTGLGGKLLGPVLDGVRFGPEPLSPRRVPNPTRALFAKKSAATSGSLTISISLPVLWCMTGTPDHLASVEQPVQHR